MKRTVLALLAAFILAHAPWRLAALAVEVVSMHPSPNRTARLGNNNYWTAMELEAKAIHLGYEVKYTKDLRYLGRPMWGTTDTDEHVIEINTELSWNGRANVLAHELAHVLQPGWLQDEAQADAFAETVATLVAHDGLREHARYLSRDKGAFVLVALTEWQRIYHAVTFLEDR